VSWNYSVLASSFHSPGNSISTTHLV